MLQVYRDNGFVTEESSMEEEQMAQLSQRLNALREIVPEWQ